MLDGFSAGVLAYGHQARLYGRLDACRYNSSCLAILGWRPESLWDSPTFRRGTRDRAIISCRGSFFWWQDFTHGVGELFGAGQPALEFGGQFGLKLVFGDADGVGF